MKPIDLLNNKIDKLTEEISFIKILLQKNNNLHNKDETLDIKQAADFLKLSVSRLYQLIYAKKLIPMQRKKGTRLLFSKQLLMDYTTIKNKQHE